jgi:hypothetical protein
MVQSLLRLLPMVNVILLIVTDYDKWSSNTTCGPVRCLIMTNGPVPQLIMSDGPVIYLIVTYGHTFDYDKLFSQMSGCDKWSHI